MTFRKDDEWLLECVDKLLEVKKEMGIGSSFSYELIRLAKNGMSGEMKGRDLDRDILKGGIDDK